MNFEELLTHRKSIRLFKNTPVSEELIEKIIEQTMHAPSAGNLQAYKIYIIENKETINNLQKAVPHQGYLSQTGLVFVFCALPEESGKKYGERGSNLYALQDATIATTYCLLTIANMGLASVWIGAFNDKIASNALNLPDNEMPVALLPIGYPDETPSPTDRKPVEQVVKRIK